MKISDKFPEIKLFIENPTSYEILYYQDDRIHNEYPLEVSEAKEIFDYIDYLESKCKKQKEVIAKANKYLHTRWIRRWSNGTHYRGLDGLQAQVLENILEEVSEWK